MQEALASYVSRVKELADHCKGNEQATRVSLIGPLFTLLGYDLTDPRQCVPEYRVDFGKDRSRTPIDWAFLQGGRPIFFVEAKEVTKKLAGYDEQLADYFAKAPEAKLGILTNGVQWRFFTDYDHGNVMDKEPLVTWDVLKDEQPPIDFLSILQKSTYTANLLRTYAERTKKQSDIIKKLDSLLEPSPEFTKLVIAGFETRNLTAPVVESWKSIVASAIVEWAKRRQLSSIIDSQANAPANSTSTGDEQKTKQPQTTQEELNAFGQIQKLLGPARPVAFEDSASYFKIHIADQRTWVMCRLQLDKRRPVVSVPLPQEKLGELPSNSIVGTVPPLWSTITLESIADLSKLGPLLQLAWDTVKGTKGSD